MTVKLLGVSVEVGVAAALLVTSEKSPVLNVAKDIGLLWMFVFDLFISCLKRRWCHQRTSGICFLPH